MAVGDAYYGIDIGTANCSVAWLPDSPRTRGPMAEVQVVKFAVGTGRSAAEQLGEGGGSSRFASVVAVPAGTKALGGAVFGRFPNLHGSAFECGHNLFYSVKSDLGTQTIYEHACLPELTTPVGVTAAIVEHLVGLVAEQGLPDPRSTHTVITVPANFGLAQRKDTLDAVRQAGLHVEEGDLLDEPVAALLDLCNSPHLDLIVGDREGARFLVFDFGAGTCDVAVMQVQYDWNPSAPLGIRTQILGIGPYERFGGDNLDAAILEHVIWPQVCAHQGIDREELSERLKGIFAGWHTPVQARYLKETMCQGAGRGRPARRGAPDCATKLVEHGGQQIPGQIPITMTQAEFDAAMAPFFSISSQPSLFGDHVLQASILRPIEATLEQAGLEPSDIDFVVLNGGSCHNPYVRRCLEQWGYYAADRIVEAPVLDTSVARGAALHCLWKHARGRVLVPPIASEDIDIITREGEHVTAVASGTILPYLADGEYARVDCSLNVPADSLSVLLVPIYTGNGLRQRLAGTGRVPLDRDVPAGTPVEVEVRVDANRISHWRFRVLTSPPIENDAEIRNPWVNRVLDPDERALERVEERIRDAFLTTGHIPPQLRLEHIAALHHARDLRRAKETAEELLDADPENAAVYNWLGLIWGSLGRHDKSWRSHDRAAALDPDEPVYLGNSGAELVSLGSPAEGIPKLREALVLDPSLTYCHTFLAFAYQKLGEPERAEQEFRRAIQLVARRIGNSSRPRASDYSQLADLQRWVGDYEEADKCAERARALRQRDLLGADPTAIVSSLNVLDLLGEADG